jgi:cellulase
MKVLAPLALASAASAHTIFQSLEVGGVNNGQGQGVRIPSYNGPIEDVTSNSLACNGAPNPTTPTSKVITVQAGSTVNAIWRYMLSTTGSAPNDIMDSTHKGPSIAYLKKVSDATTDSGVGNGWFKIQQDGFNNGVWGTEKIINGQGKHPIIIPSCFAPGQYLLRGELIALLGAGFFPGAQFYMVCAQINVVGGSGSKTPSTVSFPGAYSVSFPSIILCLFRKLTGVFTRAGHRPRNQAQHLLARGHQLHHPRSQPLHLLSASLQSVRSSCNEVDGGHDMTFASMETLKDRRLGLSAVSWQYHSFLYIA